MSILQNKDKSSDFIQNYIHLLSSYTETKNIAHLWCILTSCSALIGRRRYIPFGTSNIYPNMYVMLVGPAGSRKSTAIKESQKFVEASGYSDFAFESGSKIGFFDHLADKSKDLKVNVDVDDMDFSFNLGETHSYICSDEFIEFIGSSNISFLTL